MANCKNCGEQLSEGLKFCTACGTLIADDDSNDVTNGNEQDVIVDASYEVEQDDVSQEIVEEAEIVSEQENTSIDKEDKPKSKGFFARFMKKSEKEEKSIESLIDIEEETVEEKTIVEEETVVEVPIQDEQSVFEQEASKWANDIIEPEQPSMEQKQDFDITESIDKPVDVANVLDTGKTTRTTQVFTTRGKNSYIDKFLGLILVLCIATVSVVGFLYGSSVSDVSKIVGSLMSYAPLFIVALSGLVLARTGNIDFTPIAIMVFVYYLLVSGFNQQQYALYLTYAIVGVVVLGIVSGVLSAVFLIPNVFISIPMLAITFAYANSVINDGYTMLPEYSGIFTEVYLPIALVIFAFLATYILIFTSRLAKPIYKRKGIMHSDRMFYTVVHVIAYAIAAVSGIVASITVTIDSNIMGIVAQSFDYMVAMIFIICICGCSTWFDNGFMPQIMFILGFVVWFAIDFIIGNMVVENVTVLTASAIKAGILMIALIADRVYTRNQLPDYYNTVCMKTKE